MTTTFKWQPVILLGKDQVHDAAQTNRNFRDTATAIQTLDGTAVKTPTRGGGFVINSGISNVTGSLTKITSGLDAVTSVIAGLENAGTPTNFWVTARVTPDDKSKIDLFVWKPTAAGNTTPIAATTAITVNWLVFGTSAATQ